MKDIEETNTDLIDNNIVFLNEEIEEKTATKVIESLLYIASQNEDDIELFIKTPGGNVDDGLAIMNAMYFVKNDIKTICIGDTSSMGSFILAAGTKNKRFILPFSRIMIHQLNAGADGTLTEMRQQLNGLDEINEMLLREFAKNTGKKISYVRKATSFDNYMSAQEACEFGIVDKVIRYSREIK